MRLPWLRRDGHTILLYGIRRFFFTLFILACSLLTDTPFSRRFGGSLSVLGAFFLIILY